MKNVLKENDMQSETNPFDIFKVRPLLKLKLSWSQEPTNGLVNRPKLYQQSGDTNGVKKDGSSKDRLSTLKCHSNDIKNGEFLYLITVLYYEICFVLIAYNI